MNEERSTRPVATGWVATAIGGTIGATLVGLGAMVMAFVYLDDPDAGLEALALAVMWTGGGAFVGAVIGATWALRLRGYRRALASGLAFASIVTLLLLGWALLAGQVLHQWDEGFLLLLTPMTAIPVSAWSARMLVTLGGKGAGSTPPG